MPDSIPVVSTPRGPSFSVRVIPRARRTEVAGVRGDAVLVRLAAPPVDGAANDALVRFLADVLGCSRTAVHILSGETARTKRIAVGGMTAARLAGKLSAMLQS